MAIKLVKWRVIMQLYMFNKPKGCITARSDEVHKTVMDYFPEDIKNECFPVGRLDKDTTGLLLITDDGKLLDSLMSPDKNVSKTYEFWAYGELDESKLDRLRNGIDIGRGREEITAPCEIQVICQGSYEEYKEVMKKDGCEEINHKGDEQKVVLGRITITQGKKHQVKRMLRAEGCYIVRLKRVSIGNMELDKELKPGEYKRIMETNILL